MRYVNRRAHVLLRGTGWGANAKRTYRTHRELGLQLRSKTLKRLVKAKQRDDRRTAAQPYDTRAMDFLHDQLATGETSQVSGNRLLPMRPVDFSV